MFAKHRRMWSHSCAGLWALAGLLVFSEGIYLALLRLDATNGLQPVLVFLALLAALFALYAAAHRVARRIESRIRATLLIVAAGAGLFRVTLLPAGLPHDASWREMWGGLRADLRGESLAYERFQLFDDDIWRYLWDGHVWAHGVNPYLYSPADSALDPLAEEENSALTDGRAIWSDVRDNITYPSMPTLYPPLAQVVFRLSHRIAPGSVLALKGLITVFDLLAAWFIALTLRALGRPMSLVLLYAWNPLVIKVFAASGHVDSLLVAALAATTYFLVRGVRALAALSFGLAVLAKLSPLVLVPFVVKRLGWRNSVLACGIVLGGYIPFLSARPRMFSGLVTFAGEWQFNAGPFALVQWAVGPFSAHPAFMARVVIGLALLAWVLWLVWYDDGRGESFAAVGASALGGLIVLSPAVMPWYVTWVLPPAVIAKQRVWICFSALVGLAFFVMVDGTERSGVIWLEYALLAVVLCRESWRMRRLRAAHVVGGSSLASEETARRAV